MKMVIVQNEKKIAIALRDDGTFVKLQQQGYQIGQTLTAMPPQKSILRFSRAAVAAAIIIVFGATSAFAAKMPYSYVMIDVNPSLKYTLNIFDHVLSIDAVNEDAEPIVEALNQENINYSKLDDAIDMTIEQCQQKGYLYKDSKDYVVLSVMSVSHGKTDTLAKSLEQRSFGDGLIAAEIVSSTIDEMKEDEQQGTTPGKKQMISKMQKRTRDNKPSEDWIHEPIRNIMEASEAEDAVQSQQADAQTVSETENNASRQRTQDMTLNENQDMQNVPASSKGSAPFGSKTGNKRQPSTNKSEESTLPDPQAQTQTSPPISDETAPTEPPHKMSSPESMNEDGQRLQTEKPSNKTVNSTTPEVASKQPSIHTRDNTVNQTPAEPSASDTTLGNEKSGQQQSHEPTGRQPSSSFGR
ncbi:MAG: hypothetical protein PHU31_10290 [Anaerotignum sp.]|nr:hypothetical protein [Anaerotignum sp.]